MLVETNDAAADRHLLAKSTAVAVSVFALAVASLAAERQAEQLAAIWPANAVVLAMLLRSRRTSWPAILTAGLIGNLAAKFFIDPNLSPGIVLAISNSLEILLCATLMVRFAGMNVDLSRPKHLWVFLGSAGLAAPAVSAVFSATALTLWRGDAWLDTVGRWWATDALGLLIVTPALLALTPASLQDLWRRLRTGRGALSVAALTLSLAMVFGQSRFPVSFLIPATLIFVAFELHLAGAALALLVNAAVATALTLIGVRTSNALNLSQSDTIVVTQGFLATMTLLVLPVAAALSNRVRLKDALLRKQAEAIAALGRLGESETRYRMLAERTVDLIVRYDLNGVIEYISPSIRQYGFEPEQLVGRQAGQLVHPDEALDLALSFAVLASGNPLPDGDDKAFRMPRSDGGWAWVEANPAPVRDEAGKVVGGVSVLRDITQRRAMEEELRRRTDEAEAVAVDLSRTNWALSAYAKALSAISHFDSLEHVAAAICSAIVEQDEYVLAAVGRADPGPGLPIVFLAGDGPARGYLDELELSWSADVPGGRGPTGRAVRDFVPIEVTDSLKEPTLAPWHDLARRFGIRSSVSVPFRSGQNAMGVLIIYARAPNAFGPRELELFFNLGRELGLAVSMSEARERMAALELARHAAEQAALSAQLDLVRAGRILSVAEVTTSIAHEVNQPITAILANAESALNWIDRSPPDLGPARAAIERVVRDAERAGETVNRVRRLISKEAPQPSPCSLNDIVEATLAVMEPEIRSGGVQLDLRLASPIPQVEVDKVQIEQVLVNLITNSLDAMRKGAQGGGARRIVVRTSLADADTALVAVEDNGDGFDSAIREKMFEHFFTTKNGGVGLGLALCAAIVQSHGGRIWATPAPEGGAIFQFTLPLVAAARNPAGAA
jgi:PAS domain S-box-containing protein